MVNKKASGKKMAWGDLFDLRREDIRALYKTTAAFFLTFYVWFNMAPLVTTIVSVGGLTMAQLKLLAVCNVALTVPARIFIGMASDHFGPRRTFSALMVIMAVPALVFAFSTGYTEMLVSRLIMSMVGAGFVIGIHMTSLWFKPRDIGFAEGVEAGLGNWGSSIAAMTIPAATVVSSSLVGAEYGWRYGMALSAAVMMLYGVYYWFGITDGPVGSTFRKPRRAAAIEVSTWGDLGNAIVWTVPIMGVLALLAWRVHGMGFMNETALMVCYGLVALGVLYQMVQLLRVNVPILKRGVPEDDKYRFTEVAVLCAAYVVTFGAELGVVSMLPAFYQKTFALDPVKAGLVGGSFAFLNFFSRALGGYISDRVPSRKGALVVYLAGTAATFGLMGLITPAWPLPLAILVTLLCALFVTGGCGTTFALVPLVKRRVTGQVAGYAGAYGNVGATIFLTAYTFVSSQQFFFLIGAVALASFLFAVLAFREPAGAFAEEYHLSSVDRALEAGHAH